MTTDLDGNPLEASSSPDFSTFSLSELHAWPTWPIGGAPAHLVIAAMCHEVNRAYCYAQGDLDQPRWEHAPGWQRRSVIAGVLNALCNQVTPEEGHQAWLRQKEAEGWSYGEEKDPEAKTHPCMRPYAELPAEQRQKDVLFLGVVALVATLRPPR